MRYSFFLIFIFLTSVDSVAQHSVYLQPDRPGLSTGTHTMTPKMYQVEFGYQRSFGRAIPRVDSNVFPEFLIRTGLTSQVEISLFWHGWEIAYSDDVDPLFRSKLTPIPEHSDPHRIVEGLSAQAW
jgi:hypothetical protein